MVENWYEYHFRLRCYVSSWGGQYLEGSFFLVEIGESWKKIGTNTILDERGYVSSGLEFTNNLKKIESGWFLSQIKIIL